MNDSPNQKKKYEYLDERDTIRFIPMQSFREFPDLSVVIQHVFWSSIHWLIQNPIKLLMWSVLRK